MLECQYLSLRSRHARDDESNIVNGSHYVMDNHNNTSTNITEHGLIFIPELSGI